MGKKKSVVLMVLLTIVIVALCVLTAFPAFTIPGTNGIKKWNPAVLQYDLGMDLGGGYYAYYYPEGVISEKDYNTNLEVLEGTEKTDYETSYVQHGGLYLSTDPEDEIVREVAADGTVTMNEEFVSAFEAAAEEIAARFAAKGYSEHRVAVVDDYAIRVELPASENTENYAAANHASQALSCFALTGEMSIEKGGSMVDELKEDGVTVKDLIKSIKVKTQYEVAYIEIKFTSKGKEMVSAFVSEASASTSSTLDITIGGEVLMQISSEYIEDNVVKYSIAEESDRRYVETLGILLNSAMNNGGYDVEFTVSEVRTFAPVYRGENVLYFVYAALLAVILGLIVFAIVKTGRYGVVNTYATLSYLIITALCYAFITKGVMAITPGSLLIFLLGLVLINVFHYHVYNAIKAEFLLGKTVESSVKGGYKKTLWGMIDIYAVLLLASLALLIGAAGLQTLAIQAIISIVAAAFCSLLWARGINFVFLSASKDKYKYFRFVREDDDDE